MRLMDLCEVSENKSELTIRLPATELQLSAKDLERAIIDLIAVRTRMLPAVTPMSRQGELVPAVRSPLWQLVPSVEGVQLHIFYNGLGWLLYVFSREDIAELAAAVNRANSQPPDPPAASVQQASALTGLRAGLLLCRLLHHLVLRWSTQYLAQRIVERDARQ